MMQKITLIIAVLALIVGGVAMMNGGKTMVVEKTLEGVTNLDALVLSEGLSTGAASGLTEPNATTTIFGKSSATTTIEFNRVCFKITLGSNGNSVLYATFATNTNQPNIWATSTSQAICR